jgi:hypothetical protein
MLLVLLLGGGIRPPERDHNTSESHAQEVTPRGWITERSRKSIEAIGIHDLTLPQGTMWRKSRRQLAGS